MSKLKYYKKSVFIICVLFIVLVSQVFAVEPTTMIKVIPNTINKEVIISVEYTSSNMCGGSFNFIYDTTALQLVSIEEGETIKDTSHFINSEFAEGTIRFNWVSTTELPADGILLNIKFEMLNQTFNNSDISIEKLKIADGDGKKLIAEYEVIYQDAETTPETNITHGNSNSSNRKPSTVIIKDEKTSEQNDAINTVLAFKDVEKDDWFYENVLYVAKNKLMNGISDTQFAPNNTLTRAMLVTVLYRGEGEPGVNKGIPFADVDMGAWYANAVVWAKQNGIVNGINETDFAPNSNITREQIATIMYRYAGYKGYDVSIGRNANILHYTDFVNISEYAISPMQYAIVGGILKGKTETTLNPKDNATRAEFATVLQRFIENNK